MNYEEIAPFQQWRKVLQSVEHRPFFFVALLISSGIAATVGGVVTAIIVKYAKVAYAILIGFISVSYTHLDVYKRQVINAKNKRKINSKYFLKEKL